MPITVTLELEWVLRARYGFSPELTVNVFRLLIGLENVIFAESVALQQALSRHALGWDFGDALHHALSEGCDDFVSFDADLLKRGKRIAGLSPPVVKA